MFGRNLHLKRPKVTQVVDDILGVPRGTTVEHGDGRQDSHVIAPGVHVSADEAEGLLAMPLNDIRRMVYEYHRERGETHEQAVRRLGTQKVEV